MQPATSSLAVDPAPQRLVELANPRGFCAGVRRAIEAVEAALDRFGAPVYVRRAIVHNQSVVDRLEGFGAIFVEEIDQIPEGAIAVLSAHGTSRAVKQSARTRNLRVIDAVCPLVAKVYAGVERWYQSGRHVVLIGHLGHPEVIGALGQVPTGAVSVVCKPGDLDELELAPNTAVAYCVQTTFSLRDAAAMIAAIKRRFPDAAGPRSSDICYATTNRQQAIEPIAARSDLVLVAGDTRSSNARRLVEVARAAGCPDVRLVSGTADIPADAVLNARRNGLTAAASTPDDCVTAICAALRSLNCTVREVGGVEEATKFRPVELDMSTSGGVSGSLEERLEGLRKDIDIHLDRAIGHAPDRDRRLADAMRYGAMGGGKRFRAFLAAAVGELVGAPHDQALRVGAAIECVHAQSLVHDDLPCMDDDDLRRGRPTVHRKFDEATAVLAGDALLALAFEILADEATHPKAEVRAALVLGLARAVGQDGLAGGQMMDLYPSAKPTRQELLKCESRKTGALIRYAVEAGVLLGNCSNAERDRLVRFGENLGLAFQIRDDLLDSVGDEARLGKAVRKDCTAGRKNASSVLGLESAAKEAVRLEGACRDALEIFGTRAIPLRDLATFAINRLH